jgi:hypothetical protein
MMFNATFTSISVKSWRSVLLVRETRVSGENHRPAASHKELLTYFQFYFLNGGCRDRDRMVVGFTTSCVIGAYHH